MSREDDIIIYFIGPLSVRKYLHCTFQKLIDIKLQYVNKECGQAMTYFQESNISWKGGCRVRL